MQHKELRNFKVGPEAKIQDDVIRMLRYKGWFVEIMHGNTYQFGIPDLFATHSKYGHRWIEIKNPEAFSFTPAQLEKFPKLVANGSGIWILVAAIESEYLKLFQPCNWWVYLSIWRQSRPRVVMK